MTTATATKTNTATMASHDGHTMSYTANPGEDHATWECSCGFIPEDGFWGHYHMRDGRTPTA